MRRILGLVPDLFFATRIAAVARAEGAEWHVAPATNVVVAATDPRADLVLVDLHAPGGLDGISALKADAATRGIPVIGFHSHVDVELRTAALAAGADRVLPRSAFTRQLADLVAGRPASGSPVEQA